MNFILGASVLAAHLVPVQEDQPHLVGQSPPGGDGCSAEITSDFDGQADLHHFEAAAGLGWSTERAAPALPLVVGVTQPVGYRLSATVLDGADLS